MFKQPNYLNVDLYELEAEMVEIEHWEPIIVGFLILQYAM